MMTIKKSSVVAAAAHGPVEPAQKKGRTGVEVRAESWELGAESCPDLRALSSESNNNPNNNPNNNANNNPLSYV